MLTSKTFIAHRAKSSKDFFGGPENSQEAVVGAVRNAVPVEFDVRPTEDGVPVLSHGVHVMSPDGRKTRIDSLQWSAVRDAHEIVGDNKAPLTTLDALFAALAREGYEGDLHVDLKDPRVTPKVIDLVRQYGLQQQVTCISYSPKVLFAIHEQLSNVRLCINTIVMNHNASTILRSGYRSTRPLVIPLHRMTGGRVTGSLALGGSCLPDESGEHALCTAFTSLPEELRSLLRETRGWMWVVAPRLGGRNAFLSRSALRRILQDGRAQEVKVGIWEPTYERACDSDADIVCCDEGEKLAHRG